MSEKEQKPNEKPEVKEDVAAKVVDESYSLMKSKNIGLEELVEELTTKLDAANSEIAKYKSHVENDAKAELLAYIVPRYNMAPELLTLKTFDELKDIKSVMEKVAPVAFKSGTPISIDRSPSPRSKLASVHDDYMASLGGKK